jgi:hypothetical protein
MSQFDKRKHVCSPDTVSVPDPRVCRSQETYDAMVHRYRKTMARYRDKAEALHRELMGKTDREKKDLR